ncbi:hypothetical protein N7466_003558 [Penicillium verhagenii]|uniref:uncharacterized protein n=1 Tax=Penicillium verhagenii TaxID=1562060 RepID=UPI002545AFB4|nr:uncharacterized protein N7466_003558 [Penicillium verhagenii]KAJ5937108.1 hypothetical protein N7466_003558 [Penicillium verhagenii]
MWSNPPPLTSIYSVPLLTALCQGNSFKHVDDKGDHLLVDENFNINGIIDWQFARAVPASEAFGPSYITADLMSLYSSNTGVTGDDHDLATALGGKGSYNLALIAERNEFMRRFHHGLASELNKDEARKMLKGLIKRLEGELITDLDAWIAEQTKALDENLRWRVLQASLLDRQPALDSSKQLVLKQEPKV